MSSAANSAIHVKIWLSDKLRWQTCTHS